jgi:ribosomal protein S18 acetylase RimI-like enzyme
VNEMRAGPSADIVDVTEDPEYERFLYWCIFHTKRDFPGSVIYGKYRDRRGYLESAIPKGFQKKVLFYKGDHVGMIEYAPAEVSGLPIMGENVIVMNCIWVHRRAAGHHFGKRLVAHMMEDEKGGYWVCHLGL